jgi:hypothetical protein
VGKAVEEPMNQNPDPKPEPPDLATLRDLYGHPVPSDLQSDAGRQIRPGLWRKGGYGQAPVQRYMLRPTKWELRKEIKQVLSSEEIAKQIDNRPLLQLRSQINDVIGQFVVRAAAGDDNAIHGLVAVARGIIAVLDTIEKAQSDKLRAAALESPDWPVLLSQNRQDIEHATETIRRLGVGEEAATPRRRGQKLNPRAFWHQLASTAFEGCRANKVIVPELKRHCAGIKPRRTLTKIWGTRMEASFYYVSSVDLIVITDWEDDCVSLSTPVTSLNLKQWWHVVKHYVLEYWYGFPQEYAAALLQIGRSDLEGWRRRDRAIGRLKQAFRDLVELR